MIHSNDPEDWPDKTLDEAIEEEEDLEITDEDWDEVEGDIKERRDLMELSACSAMFGRMLADSKITFREYMRLTNIVEEYQDEWETHF